MSSRDKEGPALKGVFGPIGALCAKRCLSMLCLAIGRPPG